MIEAQSKHQVSTGFIKKDRLANEKQIGTALLVAHPDKPYYKLKLWQFPNNIYYLVKNRDNEKYTLFSKILEPEVGCDDDFATDISCSNDQAPTFQCPLGYAFEDKSLKEFIQVQFNFPWAKCFLSLYPEH